jgi:integral membrane protein (TIGR00529 family)
MHPGLYALLCVALALTTFTVLHQRRMKIGRAMLLSALCLAWLLGVAPRLWWSTLLLEWQKKPLAETTPFLFLTLTGLVLLVNVLGTAMQETGVSKRLAPALQHLFRSRRAALATIPFIMGMLPTPGGIMLSAPMVRDLGDNTGVARVRQASINFFFRHQLETVWPLFPSVPLIQAMLQVTPGRLLAHNLVISLSGLIAGTLCLLVWGFPAAAPASATPATPQRSREHVASLLHALWPIALTAGLYVGLGLPAALGILASTVGFLAVHRVPRTQWRRIFASSMEWDFALLILGALLYKLDLDAAGAVADIADYLRVMHVPVPVLVFSLPFLVGYVTGVTMPTVAMTFPLLKVYMGEGATAHLGYEVLGFAGVICGLFLTPVHLCLALSGSYFGVPLGRVLREVLAPTIAVAAAAFAMALLLR